MKTALDLASFEVVRAFRQPLLRLLEAHRPDFLICNEVRHRWPLWRLAPLMHSIMPMACSTAPHQPSQSASSRMLQRQAFVHAFCGARTLQAKVREHIHVLSRTGRGAGDYRRAGAGPGAGAGA